MRLYRGKVETIAEETIRTLREQGSVELEDEAEARRDIEAVLKEYLRLEREIVDDAKNRMEVRGLGYSQLGKVRSQVSKERGAPGQDEILPYLLDQIMHLLFHSANIDMAGQHQIDFKAVDFGTCQIDQLKLWEGR